jgi:hypothetical protein
MLLSNYLAKNTIPFSTHDLFNAEQHKGFDKVLRVVLPYAYDGQVWKDAKQSLPNVQKAWLNNPSAGWTSLLYYVREKPSKFFQTIRGKRVDDIDFANLHAKMNKSLKMIQDAIEASRDPVRMRCSTEQMEMLGTQFYLLLLAADTSRPFIGEKFNVELPFQDTAFVKKTKQEIDFHSELLQKCALSDIDPAAMFFRAYHHEAGFFHQDTLWAVIPGLEHQLNALMFCCDFLPLIAKEGGSILFAIHRDNEVLLNQHYSICPSANKMSGKWGTKVVKTIDKHWIVSNV